MKAFEPIPWSLDDILTATGGKLTAPTADRAFAGISIDSRTIAADELYVAIVGRNHDGHKFIRNSIAGGATGALVHRDNTSVCADPVFDRKNLPCIAVPDTTRALGDLAGFQRRRAEISLVAVTGSNGKTSTREMMTAVAAQKFALLTTRGNLNNEIGLPLTLLRLSRDHRWAIVELAMNRPGEIRRLTDICAPDIGVITNIGPAHLQGLGSIEGVMHAKGELLETMHAGATAVLNADDPRVSRLAAIGPSHIVTFGRTPTADVRAESIAADGLTTRFTLVLPDGRIDVHLMVPGLFMVSNALAAAAVGMLMGLDADRIRNGLESFQAVSGRMHVFKTGGIGIVDDTYNANPGSMEAAINTLSLLKGNRRAVLVAGDMLELGRESASLHRQIGKLAARAHIDGICPYGRYADVVAAGARDAGMNPGDIIPGDKKKIVAHLVSWLKPGDWVLVKASRAMGMESVVRDLKARLDTGHQIDDSGPAAPDNEDL